MHIATSIKHSDASIVPSLRQLVTRLTLILVLLALFLFLPHAQAQIVQIAVEPTLVAVEPTLAAFQAPVTNNTEQSKDGSTADKKVDLEQTKKKEADRPKADTSKKAKSFIPPQRPIGQVSIDSRPKPKNGNNTLPEDIVDVVTQSAFVYAATSDQMQGELFYAKSRNHDEIFAYQPLYFEEVNLERYGRTCGRLQPVASGLRFFSTIPMLPYAMTVSHPCTTYTRKWPYGAGWGAPKVREFEPIQLKPSLVQAAAITGAVFVLP